jgi:hypothetical protein
MSKEPTSLFQKMAVKQAEIKKTEATKRALAALEEMKIKKLVINFNSLANFANVSKAWLYRHPELREQIISAREQSEIPKRTTDPEKIIQKREIEIARLKFNLARLEKENKKLKAQLEVVYGELHKKG